MKDFKLGDDLTRFEFFQISFCLLCGKQIGEGRG